MLEIKIEELNVHIKGSGTTDVMITDATLAVVSLVQHLSEDLHISQEEAYKRLCYAAASALAEYKVDVMKDETVSMPNLKKFLNKQKGSDAE